MKLRGDNHGITYCFRGKPLPQLKNPMCQKGCPVHNPIPHMEGGA